jgi:hypothetical protein
VDLDVSGHQAGDPKPLEAGEGEDEEHGRAGQVRVSADDDHVVPHSNGGVEEPFYQPILQVVEGL